MTVETQDKKVSTTDGFIKATVNGKRIYINPFCISHVRVIRKDACRIYTLQSDSMGSEYLDMPLAARDVLLTIAYGMQVILGFRS